MKIIAFLGVFIHAKWLKCESVETPTTSAFTSLNSLIRSLNAMISVGQTNILKTQNTLCLHF